MTTWYENNKGKLCTLKSEQKKKTQIQMPSKKKNVSIVTNNEVWEKRKQKSKKKKKNKQTRANQRTEKKYI